MEVLQPYWVVVRSAWLTEGLRPDPEPTGPRERAPPRDRCPLWRGAFTVALSGTASTCDFRCATLDRLQSSDSPQSGARGGGAFQSGDSKTKIPLRRHHHQLRVDSSVSC